MTPIHGQPMGCKEGNPPEHTTNDELSRIKDAYDAVAQQSTVPLQAFWNLIPESIRMDYNWSKWTYQDKKTLELQRLAKQTL